MEPILALGAARNRERLERAERRRTERSADRDRTERGRATRRRTDTY